MDTLLGKHNNNKNKADKDNMITSLNKEQGPGHRAGTIISAASSVPSSSQSARNMMMSSSSTASSSKGPEAYTLGWQAELFHEYLARKSKVQPKADNHQLHQE